MNENTPNTTRLPEQDPDLAALHTRLKREMPLDAPVGLATDIFRATVGDLPERRMANHLGWSSWTGWKYAAAVGLVFFYAALWAKPNVSHHFKLHDSTIAIMAHVIEPPTHELDEGIDQVQAEVAALAETLDEGSDFAWVDDDTHSLSRELLNLERQLNTDMF